MKLIALFCLIVILVQGSAFCAEHSNADPMPWAHEGLGCMTDSECEGITPETF